MADQEISDDGRRVCFEQWEKLGLDRVKGGLLADPNGRVGNGPVQNLAWDWVRIKEEENELARIAQTIQIERASERSPMENASRAVYAAIKGLVTAGKRAYSQNVPSTAARILMQVGAGTISQADSNQQVRLAIGALTTSGKLEAPVEPDRDWLIKEPVKMSSANDKIFIVHGHDEGAREAVARFIQTLGFDPIILHEQASGGRTLIEKVEAHGDVGFAVVLLTPDDEGRSKDDAAFTPRPRQNVLLELGYFIGRLGRDHVCALKRGDLELPSDFGGVVYEPFAASGGWKQALGRELRAAGYQVDWNKVMGP